MNALQNGIDVSSLTGMFTGADAGHGQVALVGGPVASGKTELLAVLADHAQQAGALVLQAIATRGEREIPYGVISQLMHSPAVPMDLVDQFADLLEAEQPGLTGEHDQARARANRAVTAALVRLARTAPLLIVIDDLHHADEASVQCLLFLSMRIRSARIMLACSENTSGQAVGPAYHVELVRLPHCRQVRLAPLPVEGVAELLTGRLGEAGGPLADRFHALTGGNLLLVNALLDDHRTAGEPDEPEPGYAFRNAVLSCLHGSGPAALDVALAIAVLGDAATTARVVELAELTADEAGHELRVLEAAGLLAEGRFRHADAATAVLAGTGSARCVALHARAARLLHEEGADVTDIADLLVAAGEPAESWAIGVLHGAAERALTEDDVEKAVRYLEPAVRAGDASQRVAITTVLADAEWRLAPVAAERRVRAVTDLLGRVERPVRYVPRLVRHLLWHGRSEEVLAVLGDVKVGELDPAQTVGFEALWLTVACTYPALAAKLPAPKKPAGARPIPNGAVIDTQWRAARILRSVLQGRNGENLQVALEQVLQSTRLSDVTVEPLCMALRALIYLGRGDRALPWCDRLLAEADSRKAPAWQAVFCAIRADIAVRQGDLPAAKENGFRALELISGSSWGVCVGEPVAALVLALSAMGEHKEADALLEAPVPDAMMQTVHALPYLHARGHHHLAKNRVYAALRDFLACGELATAWGVDLPALAPWRTDCAQAYLRMGDAAKAAELVDAQLNLVSDNHAQSLGETLRVLANTHEMTNRPRMLMQAIDKIQLGGNRLELARALADLGRTHHALNETSRARMMIRRAWHVAKDCHAKSICHDLLPHMPADEVNLLHAETDVAPRLATLTSAEYRTAALARHGYTNREIARRLFITVSTVEQHLTRTYRKLKVGNRTDLPAGLELSVVNSA